MDQLLPLFQFHQLLHVDRYYRLVLVVLLHHWDRSYLYFLCYRIVQLPPSFQYSPSLQYYLWSPYFQQVQMHPRVLVDQYRRLVPLHQDHHWHRCLLSHLMTQLHQADLEHQNHQSIQLDLVIQ